MCPSPEIVRKRRELIEMRCDERKLVRQFEIIKYALNELGCEELPSGCDLSIESTVIHVHDQEVLNQIFLNRLKTWCLTKRFFYTNVLLQFFYFLFILFFSIFLLF